MGEIDEKRLKKFNEDKASYQREYRQFGGGHQMLGRKKIGAKKRVIWLSEDEWRDLKQRMILVLPAEDFERWFG